MLRWMERMANKDFHRRSIPDGAIRGLGREAYADREDGAAGFE